MTKSERHYREALRLIPWGTQTNAKRPVESFAGIMPFYIKRGKGCRIWDIDGREFIDYRLSLGPVILGYCYPEVDRAVREQLKNGVLFSMASPLELELAKLVHECVPCADMVRFMKTGEGANSCAVRIARAYTGRDMIVTCGYQGYPDWFSTAASPGNGVPAFMKEYVHEIPWGNLEIAEKVIRQYGERLACVITVPYDLNENTSGDFVKLLRNLTGEYGILLIFDEVLTGFRLSLGGAQEYFGVTPDLASFAKAMANGYPISSFTGKLQYMEKLNDFVLTTTYAGETLSLAAAIATLKIMRRQKVHKHMWAMGKRLMDGLDTIARHLGVEAHSAGLPPASFLKFDTRDDEKNARLDFLFRRELYRQGIFASVRWFISYSHKKKDIDETLDRARKALRRALDAEVSEKNIKPIPAT
ncbi:MAG: aminotransferase class III-fold pyridoxal phosphate-dependent enzyme [Bacteroidota bacterium]